jgi:hypothetical protein
VVGARFNLYGRAWHARLHGQIEALSAIGGRERESRRRANNPELKLKFLQIAALYRDLALQIDDPEKWRAKLIESREAKQK